jgi:Leucine-rich repeat (LRR) protein
MGNKTSSDGTLQGKKVLESKLNMSKKTGVLNVTEQGLKIKSKFWFNLEDPAVIESLKSLDLSKNDLERLPIQVCHLIKVKVLILNRCQLSEILDLSSLTQLTDFQATHNTLENGKILGLPSSSLLRCDLSFNHYFIFPSELNCLSNLKELNLSHNSLELLDGIGALVSLTHLTLDYNKLREIPPEIENLSQLKFLSLKHNLFTKHAVTREGQSLPSSLFTSTELNRLELEGNSALTKAEVLNFDGITDFLDRRKKVKDKHVQGGALGDLALFGIE